MRDRPVLNSGGEDPYLAWALDLKARGLAFDTENDAVDYFKVHLEKFHRRIEAGEMRSFAKAYSEGRLYLRAVLKPGTRCEDGKCENALVIIPHGAVPLDSHPPAEGIGDGATSRVDYVDAAGNDTVTGDSHRLEDSMNLLIPELVQLPQMFFPSLVRFESEQERAYRKRHLGSLMSVEIFGGLPQIFSEGELGVAGLGAATKDACAVINRMVQRRPQAVDDVENNNQEAPVHGRRLDLEHDLRCITIFLGKNSLWLCGDKAALHLIELIEVLPCSRYKHLAAFEWGEHG